MIIKNKSNFFNKLLLITSGILALSSLASYFYAKIYFHETIKQSLIIIPNSSQLELWVNPPIFVYRKYYFFHVQNPKEFLDGAKPSLIERGPYVYREILEKRNIEFINRTTIKYNPFMSLYFEPSFSIGSESDIITVLNVPFVSTVEKLSKENQNFPINFLFDYFDTKLFISRSIKDIVSGYYDPLMDLAMMSYPGKISSNQFSITLNKNGTIFEELVVQTVDNLENIGKVISWNGKNKFDYWESENANKFNGKDGTFNQPFMKREKNLEIFNADMCRSYTMTYLRDNFVNGLSVYDYHFKSDIFSCSNMKKEGFINKKCLGNGVFNLSNCQDGVSSFLSQPHFLNADEKFVDSVNGLVPDNDKHDFVVHYEPISGASLGGNVRLQLNFYLNRYEQIDILKNIKPVLFPFIWFDESISVTNYVKDELRKLRFANNVVNSLPLVLLLCALISLILSFGLLFYKNSNIKILKKSNKKITDKHASVVLLDRTN